MFFDFPKFQLLFHFVHAKQVFAGGRLYFLLASPPHKQKNTETYPLHFYTFPSENQHFTPLKNPAALNPPLPFPHISHIFYSSKHPETPYLQNFERKIVQKTNQKEEDICIQEKLSQKDLIDV